MKYLFKTNSILTFLRKITINMIILVAQIIQLLKNPKYKLMTMTNFLVNNKAQVKIMNYKKIKTKFLNK